MLPPGTGKHCIRCGRDRRDGSNKPWNIRSLSQHLKWCQEVVDGPTHNADVQHESGTTPILSFWRGEEMKPMLTRTIMPKKQNSLMTRHIMAHRGNNSMKPMTLTYTLTVMMPQKIIKGVVVMRDRIVVKNQMGAREKIREASACLLIRQTHLPNQHHSHSPTTWVCPPVGSSR